MGARRLRRLALIAGVWVIALPVFTRADTGEREAPSDGERPESELRIEATPGTGYGRFAICDSLSRVRYGGLGAAARYRSDIWAVKVGGSVSAVHQHRSDQGSVEDGEQRQPSSSRTRAVVDGVAQVGIDTHYLALMGGVGLLSAVRSNEDGSSDGGFFPSLALRLGSYRGVSLELAVADTFPSGMAIAGAELAYQHEEQLRVGLGTRIDAFTLNALPTARVELPVGDHWLGLTTGAAPSEGALAWQLQLLLDFRAFSAP